MFDFKVYRGSDEIGGTCIELYTENTRILLDCGLPLFDKFRNQLDTNIFKKETFENLRASGLLPDIKGFYQNEDKSIDAVFISHSHIDHYGMLKYVNFEIPVYVSDGTKSQIGINSIFLNVPCNTKNFIIINNQEKVKINEFIITPYLMDHSAFDAFGFLVECEGKRLFYTGDFRGTGRKGILTDRLIKYPIKNLDYLFCEGSNLTRDEHLYPDEQSVETELVKEFNENPDTMHYTVMSSQNIDRIVSFYRACLKTGKTFVIDLYTAFILDKLKTANNKIPQINFDKIKIYIADRHYKKVKKTNNNYNFINKCFQNSIKLDKVRDMGNNVCMIVHEDKEFWILNRISSGKKRRLIYSMCDIYLSDKFKNYLAGQNIDILKIHHSGHATRETLSAFINAMKPKQLIPVHTFAPDMFKEIDFRGIFAEN